MDVREMGRQVEAGQQGGDKNAVELIITMKILSHFSKILLAAVLLCGAFQLVAEQPSTVPPRGKAYGYYLKDGTYVLFVYEQDGTRSLTLSKSRPKTQYQLDCTDDMRTWQTLGIMVVQPDGFAHYVDVAPNIPHRYYKVTRVR